MNNVFAGLSSTMCPGSSKKGINLRQGIQQEGSNLIILNGIMRRRLWELLGTVCVFLLAPLIVIALIFLYIYRRLVEIALRIQLRSKFAGLLKGTDSIWAIEDVVSPSIINVLLILEKTAQDSNANFLEAFKILINERLVSKAVGTTLEKLFYLRSQKYGYYFWERSDTVDLKDRIRWLECATASCDGSCEDISSESFRKNLESVCNKPLPDDHRAGWEILVGRRCPKSRFQEKSRLCPEEIFNTDTQKIPVIIRFHHSLGDGMAIVGLFFKAISEEFEMTAARAEIKSIASSDETEESFKLLKQQAKMSTGRTWLSHKVIVLTQLYEKIKEITRITMALFSFPKYIVQQAVCSMDENALHGPPQTGEKMFYWLDNVTNDKSLNLLMKIREIRKHTGSKFEDIVLAAFSASVHKYHLSIKKTAPDALTVAFPVRMAIPGKNLTLDNNFSAAALRICISNANGETIVEPNLDSQFFKRLQDITKANNELRKRSDILYNYWIMKYLPALLPAKMFMQASHLVGNGTMGFSNMRGPEKIRILNNYISKCVFWIPTRNPIALGLSLLSYGGNNLQLSLIADKSIVKNETFFKELLENTVHEIETAYNHVVLMRLKLSNLPIETSAKKDACFKRKKYE